MDLGSRDFQVSPDCCQKVSAGRVQHILHTKEMRNTTHAESHSNTNDTYRKTELKRTLVRTLARTQLHAPGLV